MSQELHLVTREEIPALLEWLEDHLPQSWGLYGLVREHQRYGWPGFSFYTLGWPNIDAACTGPVVEGNTGSCEYFTSNRVLSLYSEDVISAFKLFLWPDLVDWSKPVQIRVPLHLLPMVNEVVKEKTPHPTHSETFHVMLADSDDMEKRPNPDDMEVHPLPADYPASIINDRWPGRRLHSESYIQELIRRMPSMGIFNKANDCVGYIFATEAGVMGTLYVVPEMRRRGLAQVLVSRLAESYFKEGLPAVCYLRTDNEPTLNLHKKLGFKDTHSFVCMVYYNGNQGDLKQI